MRCRSLPTALRRCSSSSVVICIFLAGLAMGPTTRGDTNPVLIVTISSVDDLLEDVTYLTELAGAPHFGQMAGAMAEGYIQGLDNRRPIAILVQSGGEDVRPLGLLPVKDLDTFLAGLSEQLGKPQDAGNGVWELAGPAPIFVKESNDWAYVAQSAEDLDELPHDPLSKLDGLHSKYDVAVRGFIQNVPVGYREMALAQIKEGMETQLENLPEDGDPQVELKRRLAKNQMNQWEALLNEYDQLTIGWLTDAANKVVNLDMTVTAVPGTKTARQMASLQNGKTDFGGFFKKNAALTIQSFGKIPPEDLDQAMAILDPAREAAMAEIEEEDDISDPNKEVYKRIVGGLLDIVEATLKDGTIDAAVSVILTDRTLSVVSAAHVVDTQKLELMLRELVAMEKENPEFPEVKLNAHEHAGVRFHTMSVPVPDDDDAREILGENMKLAIGIGKAEVYLGIGEDCVRRLQTAIDRSSSQASSAPFQMLIALGPIMQFMANVNDNPMVTAMAAELQKAGEGDDHILTTGKPIENGAMYRLQINEGVIRALGIGAQSANLQNVGG